GAHDLSALVPKLPLGDLASHSTTVARVLRSLVVALAPGLETLAQVAQEPARVRAVDETVVVRERDVHDRPDRDHVLAELVLDNPRALDERVGAEDRALRLADDRRAAGGGGPPRGRDS